MKTMSRRSMFGIFGGAVMGSAAVKVASGRPATLPDETGGLSTLSKINRWGHYARAANIVENAMLTAGVIKPGQQMDTESEQYGILHLSILIGRRLGPNSIVPVRAGAELHALESRLAQDFIRTFNAFAAPGPFDHRITAGELIGRAKISAGVLRPGQFLSKNEAEHAVHELNLYTGLQLTWRDVVPVKQEILGLYHETLVVKYRQRMNFQVGFREGHGAYIDGGQNKADILRVGTVSGTNLRGWAFDGRNRPDVFGYSFGDGGAAMVGGWTHRELADISRLFRRSA